MLVLPIFDLDGNKVGEQVRESGKHPNYRPKGIRVSECSPHIGRITDSGLVIACEGPTDCIAVSEINGLQAWSTLGCWSSSTVPDRDWWLLRFKSRSLTVVACGDNDVAGQNFNQRVANAVGSAYPIKWPPLFRHKGDARDYISENGEDSFAALVKSGTMRNPLGRVLATGSKKHSYIERSGTIARLVEDAGGAFCYSYGQGNSKWLCPLHNDVEDPSLTINDNSGSWCCWAGCGKGGPVQWIMAWKGVDYKSALELMRKYV